MWGPGVVIINPFSACRYRRQLSKPSNMTQTIQVFCQHALIITLIITVQGTCKAPALWFNALTAQQLWSEKLAAQPVVRMNSDLQLFHTITAALVREISCLASCEDEFRLAVVSHDYSNFGQRHQLPNQLGSFVRVNSDLQLLHTITAALVRDISCLASYSVL